jgi:hypothetical protein
MLILVRCAVPPAQQIELAGPLGLPRVFQGELAFRGSQRAWGAQQKQQAESGAHRGAFRRTDRPACARGLPGRATCKTLRIGPDSGESGRLAHLADRGRATNAINRFLFPTGDPSSWARRALRTPTINLHCTMGWVHLSTILWREFARAMEVLHCGI